MYSYIFINNYFICFCDMSNRLCRNEKYILINPICIEIYNNIYCYICSNLNWDIIKLIKNQFLRVKCASYYFVIHSFNECIKYIMYHRFKDPFLILTNLLQRTAYVTKSWWFWNNIIFLDNHSTIVCFIVNKRTSFIHLFSG